MSVLGLSIPDPIWQGPAAERAIAGRLAVPFLRGRIGPGVQADFSVFRGYREFDETILQNLVGAVAARLGPDLALPRELRANDLVLLDQNPAVRARPDPQSLWVVSDRAGLRVRYLRTSGRTRGSRLEVASEIPAGEAGKWQAVASQGRNILEIVRARIVQLEREMEREPAGPAEPSGESN
jgi:hypothetical protein